MAVSSNFVQYFYRLHDLSGIARTNVDFNHITMPAQLIFQHSVDRLSTEGLGRYEGMV